MVRETTPDFSELVQSAREGDRDSFDQIIRYLEKDVMRTAFCMTGNLHDAEDVAQEVYVKIFQRIESLSDESKLKVWALRITINSARDHLRKRKIFVSLEKLLLWIKPQDPPRKYEFHSRLAIALSSLTFKERAVFVCKEIYEADTKEIAELIGCSLVTVRTHLFSARKKLQKHLEDYKGEL